MGNKLRIGATLNKRTHQDWGNFFPKFFFDLQKVLSPHFCHFGICKGGYGGEGGGSTPCQGGIYPGCEGV